MLLLEFLYRSTFSLIINTGKVKDVTTILTVHGTRQKNHSFGITSRRGLNSSLSFSSSKASTLLMFLHICFFICETDNRIDPQSGSQRQPRDTAQKKRLPEDEKVAGNSVCGYINMPCFNTAKGKTPAALDTRNPDSQHQILSS